MKNKNKVGFVIKPHAPNIKEVLGDLISYFESKGQTCLLEKAAAEILNRPDGFKRENLPGQVDLVVVLGGDRNFIECCALKPHRNMFPSWV